MANPNTQPRFFEMEHVNQLTNSFINNNKALMNMEQSMRKDNPEELYGSNGIGVNTQKIVDSFQSLDNQ
jgi:dihydroorotate dehydrogenase